MGKGVVVSTEVEVMLVAWVVMVSEEEVAVFQKTPWYGLKMIPDQILLPDEYL